MRCAERPDYAPHRTAQQTDRALDFCDFDSFRQRQGRQKSGKSAGEQRFTRARCAGHEHIVTARGCDNQRTFRRQLPLDVRPRIISTCRRTLFVGACRFNNGGTVQMTGDIGERCDTYDTNAFNNRSFGGILCRHKKFSYPRVAGQYRCCQNSVCMRQRAIKAELTNEHSPVQLRLQLARFYQIRDRNWQIECRTFFLEVCRCQVHDETLIFCARSHKTAMFDGCSYAVN